MEKENLFYNDPYLKEVAGVKVLSVFKEDDLNCAVVDKNIFYPQGGGQKGDRGVIVYQGARYVVKNTVKDKYSDNGAVLITEVLLPENIVNDAVVCQLDWAFRYAQMRLHTALHLHYCMLEKVLGRTVNPPKTADIQEGFAVKRYEDADNLITDEVIESANKELKKMIEQGAEVKTYPDSEKAGFRWWECLGYKIPCGGVHVANVKEIGNLDISVSRKKGMLTINFKLSRD